MSDITDPELAELAAALEAFAAEDLLRNAERRAAWLAAIERLNELPGGREALWARIADERASAGLWPADPTPRRPPVGLPLSADPRDANRQAPRRPTESAA